MAGAVIARRLQARSHRLRATSSRRHSATRTALATPQRSPRTYLRSACRRPAELCGNVTGITESRVLRN